MAEDAGKRKRGEGDEDATTVVGEDEVTSPGGDREREGGIGEFVAHAADLARAAGIPTLAGVSVYGTWRMLDRHGFALDPGVDPGLLASYGPTAKAVAARLKNL